jgi:hypothetical protein
MYFTSWWIWWIGWNISVNITNKETHILCSSVRKFTLWMTSFAAICASVSVWFPLLVSSCFFCLTLFQKWTIFAVFNKSVPKMALKKLQIGVESLLSMYWGNRENCFRHKNMSISIFVIVQLLLIVILMMPYQLHQLCSTK